MRTERPIRPSSGRRARSSDRRKAGSGQSNRGRDFFGSNKEKADEGGKTSSHSRNQEREKSGSKRGGRSILATSSEQKSRENSKSESRKKSRTRSVPPKNSNNSSRGGRSSDTREKPERRNRSPSRRGLEQRKGSNSVRQERTGIRGRSANNNKSFRSNSRDRAKKNDNSRPKSDSDRPNKMRRSRSAFNIQSKSPVSVRSGSRSSARRARSKSPNNDVRSQQRSVRSKSLVQVRSRSPAKPSRNIKPKAHTQPPPTPSNVSKERIQKTPVSKGLNERGEAVNVKGVANHNSAREPPVLLGSLDAMDSCTVCDDEETIELVDMATRDGKRLTRIVSDNKIRQNIEVKVSSPMVGKLRQATSHMPRISFFGKKKDDKGSSKNNLNRRMGLFSSLRSSVRKSTEGTSDNSTIGNNKTDSISVVQSKAMPAPVATAIPKVKSVELPSSASPGSSTSQRVLSVEAEEVPESSKKERKEKLQAELETIFGGCATKPAAMENHVVENDDDEQLGETWCSMWLCSSGNVFEPFYSSDEHQNGEMREEETIENTIRPSDTAGKVASQSGVSLENERSLSSCMGEEGVKGTSEAWISTCTPMSPSAALQDDEELITDQQLVKMIRQVADRKQDENSVSQPTQTGNTADVKRDEKETRAHDDEHVGQSSNSEEMEDRERDQSVIAAPNAKRIVPEDTLQANDPSCGFFSGFNTWGTEQPKMVVETRRLDRQRRKERRDDSTWGDDTGFDEYTYDYTYHDDHETYDRDDYDHDEYTEDFTYDHRDDYTHDYTFDHTNYDDISRYSDGTVSSDSGSTDGLSDDGASAEYTAGDNTTNVFSGVSLSDDRSRGMESEASSAWQVDSVFELPNEENGDLTRNDNPRRHFGGKKLGTLQEEHPSFNSRSDYEEKAMGRSGKTIDDDEVEDLAKSMDRIMQEVYICDDDESTDSMKDAVAVTDALALVKEHAKRLGVDEKELMLAVSDTLSNDEESDKYRAKYS